MQRANCKTNSTKRKTANRFQRQATVIRVYPQDDAVILSNVFLESTANKLKKLFPEIRALLLWAVVLQFNGVKGNQPTLFDLSSNFKSISRRG